MPSSAGQRSVREKHLLKQVQRCIREVQEGAKMEGTELWSSGCMNVCEREKISEEGGGGHMSGKKRKPKPS